MLTSIQRFLHNDSRNRVQRIGSKGKKKKTGGRNIVAEEKEGDRERERERERKRGAKIIICLIAEMLAISLHKQFYDRFAVANNHLIYNK